MKNLEGLGDELCQCDVPMEDVQTIEFELRESGGMTVEQMRKAIMRDGYHVLSIVVEGNRVEMRGHRTEVN